MSAPFTRRVVAIRVDTAGFPLVYTHAGPQKLIIRDIVMSNTLGAAQRLRVQLQTGSVSCDLFAVAAVPAGETVHQSLRQEMLVGDQLFVQAVTGGATFLVTGYFLTP